MLRRADLDYPEGFKLIKRGRNFLCGLVGKVMMALGTLGHHDKHLIPFHCLAWQPVAMPLCAN